MKNENIWIIICIIALSLGGLAYKNYQKNRIITDDDFDADYNEIVEVDNIVKTVNETKEVKTVNEEIKISEKTEVKDTKEVKKEVVDLGWHYSNNVLTITKNIKDYTSSNLPEWYKYKNDIKRIEIDSSVSYIGNYAFYNLSDVKKVIFKGNNITKIGKYAFSSINVDYLVLPENITEIGEYAFSSNNSMKILVLPTKLTKVSKGLAKNSKSLETVILGSSTVIIEEEAFYGCNLYKLVIPSPTITINGKIIDKTPSIGLDVFGPSKVKEYVDKYNSSSFKLYYFELSKYRPIVYGDKKTYTVEFDELHYGSSGNFVIKTLTNSNATFKDAKYMYKDISGNMILMEGLNYSGNTLKNVKLDVYINASVGNNSCTTPVQTVLFIGNSLTNGFGHGMAASDDKSDYVYYVMQYMKNMNANSEYFRYVTNPFENATTSEDRNAMVEKMIKSLEVKRDKSKPVKTIFLQYGTNSTTTEERATFVKDSVYLINRLKETYPGVKIYWIVALAHPNTIKLIKEAINTTNITLVDASYMRGTERYASYLGAKYIRNGKVYRIDSGGVAWHPGDYGFTRMANTTIDTLKQTNYCTNF